MAVQITTEFTLGSPEATPNGKKEFAAFAMESISGQ
jgi:hypothetical protein